MPKMTIEYLILPNATCGNCDQRKEIIAGIEYCEAFNDTISQWKTRGNLPACKEFLAKENIKTDCQDCVHFWCKTSFGELEPRCANNIEQHGKMYNYYSLNCKSKEQV